MNTSMINIVWFILLIAIFYFILIRPQQKSMKEHQKLISELKNGARIVTRGGIYGVIKAIGDDTVTVQVSENVKVKVAKNSIERLQS